VGKTLIIGIGRCVVPNAVFRLGVGSGFSRNVGDNLPDERASYIRKTEP